MNPVLSKYGMLPETHSVPDVLRAGLDVVFCGTALGRISAERKAYYANPGNLFWRGLHEAGLTEVKIIPSDYAKVLDYNIGLTDLCKNAYGNDAELPADAYDVNALRQKLKRYKPRIIAFTSKTGAASVLGKNTGSLLYGLQAGTIEGVGVYVLPSPSGHARRYWDIGVWCELARLLGRG